MDVLFAADAAVKEAVPAVVLRHREAGVLTWALLHQIESEVLAEVAATGKHSARMLDMLRAPAVLDYLIAHGLSRSFNIVGGLLDDARMRKVRRKWLTTLTPGEKTVLVPYIRDQSTSVTYGLNDGAVRGLEAKGILYRVSSVSYGLRFPFNMQPWAREILSAEPDPLV